MTAELHRYSDVPVRLALRPDDPPARRDMRSRAPGCRQPEQHQDPVAGTDRFRRPRERSAAAQVLNDSRRLSLRPEQGPQPYQRLERARESAALPPVPAHTTVFFAGCCLAQLGRFLSAV